MQLNQQQRQQHQQGSPQQQQPQQQQTQQPQPQAQTQQVSTGNSGGSQPTQSGGRATERDKQLMPPPPPPPSSSGDKRSVDQDINPKRLKTNSSYGEEASERDHDHDDADTHQVVGSPATGSRASGDFQRGGGGGGGGPGGRDRPSFNHYSSKPQLYNASLPFHMHGISMYPPPPPPPPPNAQQQQQQQQQQGLLQPPPPPPPPPQHHQHQYPYYNPQGQYQYNPYWMMPQ